VKEESIEPKTAERHNIEAGVGKCGKLEVSGATLESRLRSQTSIYAELMMLIKLRKETPGLEGTLLDYCTRYRAEALMWALRLGSKETIVPSSAETDYLKVVSI